MPVLYLLLFCFCALGQTRTAAIPDAGGPNLPAQKIGPNDLLAISVYNEPELTRTVRVLGEGTIRLPMLKRRIKADGVMPSELEDIIGDPHRSPRSRRLHTDHHRHRQWQPQPQRDKRVPGHGL